jgi:adenosylcobyric acid synthase
VAPFKAQNMSNNARGGHARRPWGEIGTAQYLQALAAGVVPDVRMNPLLLKPEADTRSQVVLLGQVDEELSQLPWRGRSLRVWPQIAQALDELRAENDVVVIEGAGSPAEINLHASDVVNMRVARHCARTACWCRTSTGAAPLPTSTAPGRCCLRRAGAHQGFVLNKFRGDAACWRRPRRCCKRRPACPPWPAFPCSSSTACPKRTACSTTAAARGRPGRAHHHRHRRLSAHQQPR